MEMRINMEALTEYHAFFKALQSATRSFCGQEMMND